MGKIAEQVLERIAKKDGEIAKDAVIDWDKDVWEYCYREFDGIGQIKTANDIIYMDKDVSRVALEIASNPKDYAVKDGLDTSR